MFHGFIKQLMSLIKEKQPTVVLTNSLRGRTDVQQEALLKMNPLAEGKYQYYTNTLLKD